MSAGGFTISETENIRNPPEGLAVDLITQDLYIVDDSGNLYIKK